MRVLRRFAGLLALLALAGCGEEEVPADLRVVGGDSQAGRRVIARVECGVCHVIPGIRGARGTVGPSLEGFSRRSYIAGVVPNRPGILARWVRDAPDIAPDTAMPHLPLTEQEARHVAAYLYTLR